MTTSTETQATILSPITRAVRDIGLPAVIILFLLAVLTGVLPTPLMNSLTVIREVKADQESAKTISEKQLQVSITTCELIATSKEEIKKCNP